MDDSWIQGNVTLFQFSPLVNTRNLSSGHQSDVIHGNQSSDVIMESGTTAGYPSLSSEGTPPLYANQTPSNATRNMYDFYRVSRCILLFHWKFLWLTQGCYSEMENLVGITLIVCENLANNVVASEV